ncbi:SRSO17 transposase [Bradyrhizobium sp. USDA 4501]
MSGRGTKTSEKRFEAYLEGLASVIGHADRKAPLRDYCVGLMACGGRKSVEPMAAVTAPEQAAAQHHWPVWTWRCVGLDCSQLIGSFPQ